MHNSLVGIDLVSNLTCEEAELTPDEYLKILWTAAAELPGMLMNELLCKASLLQV